MSADIRHLENAPIREALIDIQVKLPEDIIIDDIERFAEKISKDYPRKQKMWKTNIEINLKGPPQKIIQQQIGFGFIAQDKKQVVQARLNGFTVSRLKKYIDWEHLRDETKRLWKLYADSYKPLLITRVACRYINEIKLGPSVKLDEYLTALPHRIEGLPDKLEHFLTRVIVPLEDTPTKAIVTQVLEGSTPKGEATIILDIDVFREGSFAVESTEIWNVIESFHDHKNTIFFNSITEQAVELYK